MIVLTVFVFYHGTQTKLSLVPKWLENCQHSIWKEFLFNSFLFLCVGRIIYLLNKFIFKNKRILFCVLRG